MSSILAAIQGFHLNLKQFSKFQMSVKFPEQLFLEHINYLLYYMTNSKYKNKLNKGKIIHKNVAFFLAFPKQLVFLIYFYL